MNSKTPWWAGFSPAEAEVECGGALHRLRWREGQLHAVDHPDAAGERTLTALGGDRNRCIDLVDAWEGHQRDIAVLTLGSRGPSDRLRISVTSDQQAAGGWFAYAPATGLAFSGVPGAGRTLGMGGPDDPGVELVDLLALGDPLARRLSATVAATLESSADLNNETRERSDLTAAVYGRMLCALQTWLGTPDINLELQICASGDRPQVSRRGQNVDAKVPLRWLHQVWARNLAVVGDSFVVDLGTVDGRLELRTLDPSMNESTLVIATSNQ